MPVDKEAFALAGGTTWALGLFLAAVGSMVIGSWAPAVNWMGQFYLGYAPTLAGGVIGAIWGFLDVTIGLYVFLWLYDYLKKAL
ncbi:MAG: hypothetical protein MUP63_03870 [Candidatus Nanohaloarchaeota archaeon QJJ-7]|nr:hypothetical protein [Candidatus Nanohaloarchaeota archaeon QJJ-7]